MTVSVPSPIKPAIWWQLPIVWLVIGGPVLVVIASFVTLALALIYPDPVLITTHPASVAEQPAVQARNHAASPRTPTPAATEPPR